MKKKLLLHAWSLKKKNDKYFLPYSHWVYLKEIVNYYDNIVLLSPCQNLSEKQETTAMSINEFSNTKVFELSYNRKGYLGAIKYFFEYINAYRNIKDVTTYYSRYPTPFGWLQKFYSKNARRIIHYVGDPIDAAINNPNFGILKKRILTFMFTPENAMYTWACKGAEVFTNGHHITEKLRVKGIEAVPLISTTLTENDFFFDANKKYDISEIRLLYVGYLRKSKGVETILRAFKIILKEYPNSKLTLVGTGEFQKELKKIVISENIPNVSFLGHIDNKDYLNEVYRKNDVFVFASLSEGSPRVVLEAMSNGLPVVSTPVGSLPTTFLDFKEIVFAKFNDPADFKEKIIELYKDDDIFTIRNKAFEKVKSLTITSFLKTIFYEN